MEQEKETPETESERAARLADNASKGGRAVVAKYGADHMRAIGLKGASAVTAKYGLRHYSEIAARNRGVKKRRKAA
jgi:hypothetical protein